MNPGKARAGNGNYEPRPTQYRRRISAAERERHAAKMRERSKTLRKVLAMRRVWAQRKEQAI